MAMGNLTTLDPVKEYLALTVTTDDDLLENLITRLSVWAQKTRMQRVIAVSSYARDFTGTGQKVFAFPDAPAVSLVDVVIGPTTLVVDRDYWWNDSLLTLINGWVFTRGVRCQVMWTAGFTETPADIESAVIELVAYMYRAKGRIGQISTTLSGAQTASFDQEPATRRALETLDSYRRPFQ